MIVCVNLSGNAVVLDVLRKKLVSNTLVVFEY